MRSRAGRGNTHNLETEVPRSPNDPITRIPQMIVLKEVVVERYKDSCRIKSLAVLPRIKRVLVPPLSQVPASNERQTPNAKRRTVNAERQTANAFTPRENRSRAIRARSLAAWSSPRRT
jgi:hypothetical protein